MPIFTPVLAATFSLAVMATPSVMADVPAPSVHALAIDAAAVDVPAPFFMDAESGRRVGATADRFELDEPSWAPGLSSWYRLSYVVGGDRLQVHEHNAATTRGAESDVAKSENVAWHVATAVLGRTNGLARPAEIPAWARARTAGSDGTSAGIVFALADIDLLTPGPLAGNLRVAGTGTIGSDGVVTAVHMVDAKLAAARLAHPGVVFAPNFPTGTGPVTVVASHEGVPSAGRSIGDWLDTAGYERAGRVAGSRPTAQALVQIDDVRQALAWLCGRTDLPATCAIAHHAAAVSVPLARPYQSPGATHSFMASRPR